MSNSLTLKWGTIKGWNFESTDNKCFQLIKEFMKDASISCATDRPEGERKELLCEIIDELEGQIYRDWTGEELTKDEAKEYVINYGKEKA